MGSAAAVTREAMASAVAFAPRWSCRAYEREDLPLRPKRWPAVRQWRNQADCVVMWLRFMPGLLTLAEACRGCGAEYPTVHAAVARRPVLRVLVDRLRVLDLHASVWEWEQSQRRQLRSRRAKRLAVNTVQGQ